MPEERHDVLKASFTEKLTTILNMGAINLAMGMGYRLGLFDALDAFDGPRPADDIAEKAGLHPRYVLEWLNIMACGEIVLLSKETTGGNVYYLPRAHADLLTRRAGNANLGVYTQEIPLLTTCAMADVTAVFASGQGVGYDHYRPFQAFMSELANAKHRQVLVDQFLPSVDNGRMVDRLRRGVRVCDLGCGEGVALLLMARAFPESHFTGMDVSREAISQAEAAAREKDLPNVSFVRIDAATIADNGTYQYAFDYITAFDAIHDQSRPAEALKGVHHMLAPGGVFSMIDIAAHTDVTDNRHHPMGPFLYTVSLMHCMPVGLVDAGAGLGMMWGREKAIEMLTDAGFTHVSVEEIPEDTFNDHFLCRK